MCLPLSSLPESHSTKTAAMLLSISTCILLLIENVASTCPRPYSTCMADSVIARKDAIITTPGSSDYLKVGFFQTAVLRALDYHETTESACADTQTDWEEYLVFSSEGLLPYLTNATRDTGYPLDRFATGDGLTHLYDKSQNTTIKNALRALRESANLQPRNQYGGYWFYTYPNWSYLDGTYSLLPFLVDYTQRFDPGNAAAVSGDVMHQLELLWAHCQDQGTTGSGLLVHGYDSTKKASWANPVTGGSPYVWSRALGWYFMALVDVFDIVRSHDIFPSELESYIRQRYTELAKAVLSAADKDNGCWWQVVTLPRAKGNYIETSGSGMLVYGLLKGSRLGLLSPEEEYTGVAEKCYNHMLREYVVDEGNGLLGFNGTVGVCSLNSSATYEYYVSVPVTYNSLHGIAAFTLASLEHEMRSNQVL